MTDHSTTLFVSPKHGGILQSSGFLDLKSLMALNRTCKANMIDELGLILLVENEITRKHGIQAMKEAIDFWRLVRKIYPSLKQWLGRDNTTTKSITVTRYMLSDAAPYEVMLSKMLRTVPTQSERLQLVNEQGAFGRTLLHRVVESNNPDSIKTVLTLFPESERLKVLSHEDEHGWTVLHCAARTGNPESIRFLLALYPDREHFYAVKMQTDLGIPLCILQLDRVTLSPSKPFWPHIQSQNICMQQLATLSVSG